MKKILLLLLAFSLTACQKSVTLVEEKNTVSKTVIDTDDRYIDPIVIRLKNDCLKDEYNQERNESKIKATCQNLGEAQISSGIKILIKAEQREKIMTGDNQFNVYLEFYKNNEKIEIPKKYFQSNVPELSPSLFYLNISYLDKNNIYISDSGGHEGYASHYLFNGKEWQQISPWELVKKVFPDSIQPPFSILISSKYIKITEENYFSDQVFSETSDRRKNRIIFTLDRLSKKILKIEKIPRYNK